MKICPHCHQENPDQAKFCLGCGTKISPLQKETGSESVDQGERRQMTLFFCDLVDSTPLSERMDPEDYRQMILDYHDVAEKVINLHGGKVGNYIGDGLLVYFGYPEGLENSAITAVQTAIAVIEALDEVRQRWEDPEANIYIKIRVGMHTGLVIVDDHLALGETVNLAARLEGLAPHNGIVVSPQTLDLIKGWFEVKSIGKKSLKGISEPVEVFEVTGETGARTRLDISKFKGLSPLVGREDELKRLRETWALAREGKGSSLMLLGEAGIGKSRLSDKLEAEIQRDPANLLLEARCSMHHTNSAFFPLLEVIETDILSIRASDENLQRISKLKRFFREHDMGGEEMIPLLAEYLGISSETYPPLHISPFAKRANIMAGISDVFLQLAGEKPLLLVIEDLHWADASTLEWLESFKAELADKTLFLLCTARPHPKGEPKKFPSIKTVDINRLDADNMKQICLHQTRGKRLPKEVLNKIVEKTEGVPLFVEELTKMVLESDRLQEKKDHYELIGPLSKMDIPSTLQDSLLARLDQLKDVKDIVQMGSVIGREFSMAMLAAALPEERKRLTDNIEKLLNAEIFQKAEKDNEPGYQFKHALIQDTAYRSMLRTRRRQMHQKVASVLIEEFNEVCETQPEQLAYHLTEGNQPDLAIPQWLKAGQLAKMTNASQESIAHLKKGLELLPELNDETARKNLELDLLLTLGGTYMVSHGFPHPLVKETFNTARDIAQTLEVSPKLALIQMGLLGYYFNTEDYASFDEIADRMMTQAEDPDSGYWFELIATHFKGVALVRGNFADANRHFQHTTNMFDPSKPFRWELTPSGYLPFATKGWWMICLQAMGFNDQAKRISTEHLNSREEYRDSDSMTLYHIHTFPALYYLEAREWKTAQIIMERYLPIVRKFGDPVFILTAEVYYHLALSFQGQKPSFEKVVQMMDVCFEIGFKAFAVTMSSLVAEGYLNADDPGSALSWIEKILAHAEQTGTHFATAELNRLKGRSLKLLGKPDEIVEHQYKTACDQTRKQEARTFEIRAAMDLALLWNQKGQGKKARTLLKNSYEGFTEGFDSVDLVKAKSLLQVLETPTKT